MGITAEQKKLLQSTAPILKEHGKEITKKFYSTMFKEHPEMRNFFNETNQNTGKQPVALAQTFYYVTQHFDNLEVLMPQMRRISNKHRSIQVQPEHYPIVGKYLLQAIAEFLGSKATPEMMSAWAAAYDVVASTFLSIEKELYSQLGNDERDKGFIPFKIVKKETIASGPIISLTLARQDGGKMFDYRPGQYITLRIEKDGVLHNGHYTMTEVFNGQTYTVAFKQGYDIDQNSIVSEEIIHHRSVGSTILVSPPAGTFGINKDAKLHLFISGGIGIAPFVAMIQELNQQGKSSSATLIQCVRTEGHAAFAEKLRKFLPQDQYTILTQEDPVSKGHIEGKLRPETHVYVCGSEVFLSLAESALAGFNHPKSQIHMESIEPTLRLLRGL